MPPDAPAAPAAPSNGSAAPTAAAPTVAPVAPTPKNGNGAVVPKVAAEPPKPKNPWGDGSLKVKVPWGDGEEEMEFKDEADLRRRLIDSKLKDKTSKEAAELRRDRKALADALASGNKREVLKLLNVDLRAEAIALAEEELRLSEMSEDQRRAEAEDKRAKTAEQRAEKAERELQAIRQAEAEEREWKALGPHIEKACVDAGLTLPLDELFVEELTSVSMEYLKEGVVDPRLWVQVAKERQAQGFDKRLESLEPSTFLKRAAAVLSKADPAALLASIPEETLKALFRLQSEKLRAARGQTPQPKPVAKAPEPVKAYRSPGDYHDRLLKK